MIKLDIVRKTILKRNIRSRDLKHVEHKEGTREVILVLSDLHGGVLKRAQKFAQEVKKKCQFPNCKITTVVPPGKKCSSACLVIFMIGDIRVAYKDSLFGFHTAAMSIDFLRISFKIPGAIEKYYGKAGISKQWINDNKDLFKTRKLTYLTPDLMTGSNIVTFIPEKRVTPFPCVCRIQGRVQ